MNILFVNNFNNLFEKADCGASQRSMCMLRALAKVGHVDVLSFVDNTISNIPNVDVVYSNYINPSLPIGGRFNKFLNLFAAHRPYSIYPIQPDKKKIIDDFVVQKQYDIIVVRYVRYAVECGLLNYSDRLVIDVDDDQKQVILMAYDKIRTLRNKWYNLLYANTIDKMVRNITANIVHAYYSSPISTYPNASFLPNISAYQVDDICEHKKSYNHRIIMVGRYDYYPNAEGLEFFVSQIMPKIKERIPDIELHVVGKILNDKLEEFLQRQDNVILCGYVEDLITKYNECSCAIVPIYYGSGTSVKMVEAMSLGCPTIATPCGARGLHTAFIPNVDYVLANSNEEFIDGVIRVITDIDYSSKMASNAIVKVKRYYSPSVFEETIIRTIQHAK